ncbi:hypothetical protein K0F77_11940 [Bacteroides fragilis]|jgi:hypothetical protein|nr:hypothetical protein [Bacteroides fragilis]
MEFGKVYRRRDGGDEKGKYKHPFVCVGEHKGIMITHSNSMRYSDNLPLREEYIKPGHPFRYEDSYFVNKCLIKDIPDEDLEFCGEFTEVGKVFLDERISTMEICTWAEYKRRIGG